jgi:hypothetical protein
MPLASFFYAEKYEGEGSWITRIYEGEIIFKEGIRIKEFRRAGMIAVPTAPLETVRMNLERLTDPKTPLREKAEILAQADGEFRTLPAGEREKVLAILTPGELAGAYLSASGYRPDQVLGPSSHFGKSSIPYRYVLVGGIVLIILSGLLLVL